ncbi:MAG: PTS system mannose/fructose/sorbose family transporter subunit IID [Lactobacillaceae bacterium]|jgi:PTS system mannose-specific IID component|nr:PTS system mannose/fructose/sorbose family transporter subunit IID [Lactobacillaceae bacterium]
MADKKTQKELEANYALPKSLRFKMMLRQSFEQGSWNFERMHNLGFAYIMAPAIAKLYSSKEDRASALKRHMEFFNTHPYVASPIFGVTMALEEAKSKGADIDDAAINGAKVGMMGPLAGVGDPIFWGTLRPIIGAFAATSFAQTGSILGPIIFFLAWNIIRYSFLWFTQEIGYREGTAITKDLSILQKFVYGSSILGMFIMGVLVPRWTTMHWAPIFSTTKTGSDVTKPFVSAMKKGVQTLTGDADWTNKAKALVDIKDKLGSFPGFATNSTMQDTMDKIVPGLGPLLLLFLTLWLIKKNVKPITIILGYFVLGVLLYVVGLLG